MYYEMKMKGEGECRRRKRGTTRETERKREIRSGQGFSLKGTGYTGNRPGQQLITYDTKSFSCDASIMTGGCYVVWK